jgi:hypothetical protein
MDTDYFEPRARLTPARHETGCDAGVRAGHGALRLEALRQLRWQQRALARILTTHTRATPSLVVPAARAGLTFDPDVLRRAGADVPAWFDQGRSLLWTIGAARRTGSVRLADLSADITRVLAWADSAPRPLGASVAPAHPRLGPDAAGAGDDSGTRERA